MVTYREAHHASGEPTSSRDGNDGKNGSSKDNDGAEELQTNCEPPIGAN